MRTGEILKNKKGFAALYVAVYLIILAMLTAGVLCSFLYLTGMTVIRQHQDIQNKYYLDYGICYGLYLLDSGVGTGLYSDPGGMVVVSLTRGATFEAPSTVTATRDGKTLTVTYQLNKIRQWASR